MEDNKNELAKLEEQKNKNLMASMWVLIISTFVFYIGFIGLATYTFEENENLLTTIIIIATVLFAAVMFYAFKIEVSTGYYECRKCKHRFVPTYFEGLRAMHIHTTRYLQCPECNQKSWARKVMTKE